MQDEKEKPYQLYPLLRAEAERRGIKLRKIVRNPQRLQKMLMELWETEHRVYLYARDERWDALRRERGEDVPPRPRWSGEIGFHRDAIAFASTTSVYQFKVEDPLDIRFEDIEAFVREMKSSAYRLHLRTSSGKGFYTRWISLAYGQAGFSEPFIIDEERRLWILSTRTPHIRDPRNQLRKQSYFVQVWWKRPDAISSMNELGARLVETGKFPEPFVVPEPK